MISIIIPTCNRNDLLSQCLDKLSLSVQSVDKNAYEIIVTDDSKNNMAFDLIQSKYPWVNWIEGSKKGPAANRNNGAKNAKQDWLIFIDDDCLPDAELINVYISAINTYPGIKVFEGCTLANRNKKSFIEEAPINDKGGYLWSCNFMISAELFKKLDGFDESFPYAAMEDVDLYYRIKQSGNETKFLPGAFVIHPWRQEMHIINKTKKRFQSTLYILKKHPEMKKNLNASYFFRSAIINFKNMFTYAYKFRLRGVDKQFIISVMLLYFATILSVKRFVSNT